MSTEFITYYENVFGNVTILAEKCVNKATKDRLLASLCKCSMNDPEYPA